MASVVVFVIPLIAVPFLSSLVAALTVDHMKSTCSVASFFTVKGIAVAPSVIVGAVVKFG